MATPKKDPSALLGAVIENRFILQSVIGQGGLSTVYKAQHKVADRDAAVKILHDDYSNTS